MTVAATRSLSYTYAAASQPALREVSLTLGEGEQVLLVGSSGGGKSSLLWTLTGLAPQVLGGRRDGEVAVLGLDPAVTPLVEVGRRVGLVFQNPSAQLLRPTVEQDIAFGCENLGLSPAATARRVAEAMSRLGLDGQGAVGVHTLSAGWQQRVALAGVLAMGSRLLLLDEPTSSLDEAGRHQLATALARLAAEGHTVLLAEHRDAELRRGCSRVLALEAGQLAAPPDPPVPLARRRPDPPAAGGIALRLDQVTARYGHGPAVLAELTLAVRHGEMVALCGANGSGKSTVLRLLAGALKAQSGVVEVLGRRQPTPADQVGQVGWLFQNPDEQLLADTVEAELSFGPQQLRRPVSTDQWLDRLRLADSRHASPFSLSRGQRRRLALGSLLAMAPQVLLLDEPTSGLDRESWVDLLDLVSSYSQQSGAAVLFSSHHPDAVRAYADRVVDLT